MPKRRQSEERVLQVDQATAHVYEEPMAAPQLRCLSFREEVFVDLRIPGDSSERGRTDRGEQPYDGYRDVARIIE